MRPAPRRKRSRLPALLLALAACAESPPPAIDCSAAGAICTLAGTGRAQFDGDDRDARDCSLYQPMDVTVDAAGRVLISDWNNQRIRRIEADGTMATLIGTGVEAPPDGPPPWRARELPLHHASALAFMGETLLVAGNHAPAIYRVGADGMAEVLVGDPAEEGDRIGGGGAETRLRYPQGVSATGAEIFVADTSNHRVLKLDADGRVALLAGTGSRGGECPDGPAASCRLSSPMRVDARSDGALLVADTGNHAVRLVLPSGELSTLAGGREGCGAPDDAAPDAALCTPSDAIFGPDGRVYIADTGNHRVLRLADGRLERVAGTGSPGFDGDGPSARDAKLNYPSGLSFQGADLLVADRLNHRVRRIAGVALR